MWLELDASGALTAGQEAELRGAVERGDSTITLVYPGASVGPACVDKTASSTTPTTLAATATSC